MTFFLGKPKTEMAPRGPDIAPTGFLTGLSAATMQAMRGDNASYMRQRAIIAERDKTVAPVAARLGMDRIRPLLEERNRKAAAAGMSSQIVEIPDDPVKAAELLAPTGRRRSLMWRARRQQQIRGSGPIWT